MSPGRTVVLAERRMDAALSQLVREACSRAAVECVSWNGIDRLDALAGRAALAVGILPAGARRIPGDLSGLVTDQLPGLPLVLVAEEPLVRPAVSLYDGLVTLLEPPLSVGRLASCTRALLAERAPTVSDTAAWWPLAAIHADGRAVQRSEYRVGRCWIGAIECSQPDSDADRPVPWVRIADGVTGLLASANLVPPDAPGSAIDLDGVNCAVQLRLGPEGPEWMFHPPRLAETVSLYSALRLPPLTDMGQRSRRAGAPLCVPGAEGDIVVAVTRAAPAVDPDAVSHRLQDGGPALLDLFETALGRNPVPFACLVVELR